MKCVCIRDENELQTSKLCYGVKSCGISYFYLQPEFSEKCGKTCLANCTYWHT